MSESNGDYFLKETFGQVLQMHIYLKYSHYLHHQNTRAPQKFFFMCCLTIWGRSHRQPLHNLELKDIHRNKSIYSEMHFTANTRWQQIEISLYVSGEHPGYRKILSFKDVSIVFEHVSLTPAGRYFHFFCCFFFVGILIIYFWFKIRLSNVDRSDHRFSSYLEMQIQKKSRKKKVLTIKQKYLSQSYTMPINREGKKKKK